MIDDSFAFLPLHIGSIASEFQLYKMAEKM